MPVATVLPTTTPAPALQAPPPPLRRAVYIHVSDLTNAYSIDHARLEQELARVKEDRDPPTTGPADSGVPRATGASPELESNFSFPQKRLQPPRGGYNLCLLVGKVTVVVDKRRVDRSRVRLAEVEVGDETGMVSLRARDEQIDLVQEISDRAGAVVLRNCTLELYQGKHIRLAVTKWGKLSAYPDTVSSTPQPPSRINRERQFSLIDLSLVAHEMAAAPPPDILGSTVPTKMSEVEARQTSVATRQQQLHPSQAQQRRGSRSDRRTGRGKLGGANPMPVHYAPENPALHGVVRYPAPALHGFSGGYEPMEVLQYPYHRQQEGMPQGSGQHQMNPSQHQMNPSQHQMNPSQHQMNPSQHQMNPGQHQMNPGQHQMNPGQHQMNPGQHQMNPGQHQMNPGQHQMNPGQHQLLLQQQYEMQQRQLQQMYQDHHDSHVQMMPRNQGQQVQVSSILVPTNVGSGSYDTGGGELPRAAFAGSSEHLQSMMAVVGSNQLLLPVSRTQMPSGMSAPDMPSHGQDQHGNLTTTVPLGMDVSTHSDGGSNPRMVFEAARSPSSGPAKLSLREPADKTRDAIRQHDAQSLLAKPPLSPGKMNPQATEFAPSYLSLHATPPTSQLQSPGPALAYAAYDPANRPPSSSHAYIPAMMYVPVAGVMGDEAHAQAVQQHVRGPDGSGEQASNRETRQASGQSRPKQ